MKFKFGLLPRVVLAIALGVACGFFLPGWATRIALTFNAISDSSWVSPFRC